MTRLPEVFARIFGPAPVYPDRTDRYPNFDLMRLLLAAEVVFAHAWSLIDPEDSGWAGYVMAVPAFLAISGFLVLQSYEVSASWQHFMKKRALRLLPALVLSFALTFALFDWDTTRNCIVNWITGGIYKRNFRANAPLWSLAWEELAYLTLAMLWALGAYRRPIYIWLLLASSIAIVWMGAALSPHARIILFLGPAFLIGNLMYLYRGRLLNTHPLVPWIALYAMLQYRFSPDAQLLGGATLVAAQAFCVVWVGMAGFRVIPFRIPDISYGVYIYHVLFGVWLLNNYAPSSLTEMLIYMSALLIPFSLASWYLVEKPALKLKDRFRLSPAVVPAE